MIPTVYFCDWWPVPQNCARGVVGGEAACLNRGRCRLSVKSPTTPGTTHVLPISPRESGRMGALTLTRGGKIVTKPDKPVSEETAVGNTGLYGEVHGRY